MFVLKSLGRLILGNNEQKELVILPNGSLWQIEAKKNIITRTRVYEKASLTLQRQGQPFEFTLHLEEIKEKPSGTDNFIEFSLFPTMEFTRQHDKEGEVIFTWFDREHKYGYEFIVSTIDTTLATLEMFHIVFAQCLYENKERKAHGEASDLEIQQLIIVSRNSDNGEREGEDQVDDKGVKTDNVFDSVLKADGKGRTVIFQSELALFYVFDASTSIFMPKGTDPVRAIISKGAEYEFYLYVVSQVNGEILHYQKIDPDATLHTDRNNQSFIWCYFSPEGFIWTFSLRFVEPIGLMGISNAIGQAVYEILNQVKMNEADKEYLMNPFIEDVIMKEPNDLSLLDTDSESDDGADSDDENSDGGDNGDDSGNDNNDDNDGNYKNDNGTDPSSSNQQLAVGYKYDRSFVARGHSIGIFKHTTDDSIKLHCNIDKVQTTKGRLFSPTKMMLHEEDRSMLLLDSNDPGKLFKMDLEYGKVVEDWQIHPNENGSVTSILPDTKYSQLTNNQTLIGLNANSIFRIDPRLSGPKRVDNEMKQYVVKNDFSCGATTGKGELAVASSKGEIRLFNKLDKRAKTLLPGFGDPIIGIDVTESGKYIIATCKTYLLLVNTEIPGEQDNILGFTKSIGSKKPIPKRLQLKPEHVAYMGGSPVSFTPARFSTGMMGEERSIITSTGPYVITWNMRRVKMGNVYDYQIRKYDDKVVADSFRYGQDRSIVVTLPHHVTMISKRSLATPSPNIFLAKTTPSRSKAGVRKTNDHHGGIVEAYND